MNIRQPSETMKSTSTVRTADTEEITHVFIVGSKGIPANYGGFETFVQELVRRRRSAKLCYHIACSIDEVMIPESRAVYYYEGVQCFTVPMWSIGASRAVVYDLESLSFSAYYIRKEKVKNAVIYILACRIGPFMAHYRRVFDRLGARVFINPDGHEWERAKWNGPIKKYWKYSERKMVENAARIICDSLQIEKYIQESYGYAHPDTCFIPYGADIPRLEGEELAEAGEEACRWLSAFGIGPGDYYLIVGRFVPENNYETMIREFMASRTTRKLLIITNIEKNRFYESLREKTGFESDMRICFAGTLYERKTLLMVRKLAYAYLHGHCVGGTNPSLLEAMGSTEVNLLFDVSFNREVGGDAALYWTHSPGSLSGLIHRTEAMDPRQRAALGAAAREVIARRYTWEKIVDEYEALFTEHQEERETSPASLRRF